MLFIKFNSIISIAIDSKTDSETFSLKITKNSRTNQAEPKIVVLKEKSVIVVSARRFDGRPSVVYPILLF